MSPHYGHGCITFFFTVYLKRVVRAIKAFTAENPEEISLRRGDIIELLSERTRQGDGWWIGVSLINAYIAR